MKALKIYITLIAWVGIALYSIAQTTCTINTTSVDNPSWNWQQFDNGYLGWSAFAPPLQQGDPIQPYILYPPWTLTETQVNTEAMETCSGLNSCSTFCPPADGWVFIHKEFGIAPTQTSAGNGVANPYFVLYNKFSGILRVFFCIENSYQNSSASINVRFINGTQTALLSNSGTNYGAALDNYNANMQLTVVNQFSNTEGTTNGVWLYGDFPMTYDPCTCLQDAIIEVSANLTTVENVQLTTTGQITGGANGSSSYIVQNGQATDQGFGSVLSGSQGLLQFFGIGSTLSTDLQGYADNLQGGKLGSVGKAILADVPEVGDVAMGVAAVAPEIGLVLGAATFISSLFNHSSSTPNMYTAINYFNVDVNLNANLATTGTITIGAPYGIGDISVPGSQGTLGVNGVVSGEIPLYDQPLGVFNLVNTPALLYADYYENDCDGGLCDQTTEKSDQGGVIGLEYGTAANGIGNVYRQFSLYGYQPQLTVNPVVLNDYTLTTVEGAIILDYAGAGQADATLYTTAGYDPALLAWNAVPISAIPAYVGEPDWCATPEQRLNDAGLYFETYPYSNPNGSTITPANREAVIRTPFFSLPELAQQSFLLNVNTTASQNPKFYIRLRLVFTRNPGSSATADNLLFVETYAAKTTPAVIPGGIYYSYVNFDNNLCYDGAAPAGCFPSCYSTGVIATGGPNGLAYPDYLESIGTTQFNPQNGFYQYSSSNPAFSITTNIPYNLTLSNTTVTGTNSYQAYGTVTIGPGVIFASGSNTTIIAGQSVIVDQGTSFGGSGGPAYIAGQTVTIPPSTNLYPGTTITIANSTNLPNNIISLQNTPVPPLATAQAIINSGYCTSNYSANTTTFQQADATRQGLQANTVKTPGILNNVEVYPNPTTGMVNINLTSTAQQNANIVVTNPLGEQVYASGASFTGATVVQADLSNEPAGIYIVQVTAGNDVTTQKVIVAH